jgi:hypothetical protein
VKAIKTIRRNTEVVLEASREAGLEINTEVMRCMFMPYYQNTG